MIFKYIIKYSHFYIYRAICTWVILISMYNINYKDNDNYTCK